MAKWPPHHVRTSATSLLSRSSSQVFRGPRHSHAPFCAPFLQCTLCHCIAHSSRPQGHSGARLCRERGSSSRPRWVVERRRGRKALGRQGWSVLVLTHARDRLLFHSYWPLRLRIVSAVARSRRASQPCLLPLTTASCPAPFGTQCCTAAQPAHAQTPCAARQRKLGDASTALIACGGDGNSPRHRPTAPPCWPPRALLLPS